MRTLAIEEQQSRSPTSIERWIGAQPEVAIAAAVALGVALGWLAKRKEW